MSNEQERVLVGSIQKFSLEDGPGIRTTIFIKGCPLNCKWCHNPEMIEPAQQLIRTPGNCIGCGFCIDVCPKKAISLDKDKGEIIIDRKLCDICLKCAEDCYANALRPVGTLMSLDEIIEKATEDKSFYDNTGGGITLSGGEILMHADFADRLIDEAAKRDISVCLDTSGYGNSEKLMTLARKANVTHILYDMKSVDDDIHKEYTGVSNELIIRNLKMLAAVPEIRDKLIMRMPLIKGVNDSENIIRRTGELYREIGITTVNLLPYHDLGNSKKRNVGGTAEEFEPPSEDRISEIEIYFKDEINLSTGILGRV